MEPEVHIAGVLVHALPERVEAVACALAGWPGVEVPAASEAGRLVVVCECASDAAIVALIARIRELAGVVDAALVYQHAESARAMEEEIGDDADPARVH